MLVNSIFESISGEAGFFRQGTWCTFIRFQGCNLNCYYCDTSNAQNEKAFHAYSMSIVEIINRCRFLGNKHILITGGEPLSRNQFDLFTLISILIKNGFLVQIETNGSFNLPDDFLFLKDMVFWVVDRKGPSSGMSGKMIPAETLKEQLKINSGILKYVISHQQDLQWAINDMYKFSEQDYFLISPVDAKGEDIDWIRRKLPEDLINKVVFSVQLHKILKML